MTRMLRKIAVIQNGSLEQLLHALPAVLGLKQKHDSAQITLFCDKAHIDLTRTWSIIDEIVPVDAESIKAKAAENPNDSLALVFNQSGISNKTKFDRVVNFAFNDFSTLIATHLNSDEKLGPYLDESNELTFANEWSTYFAANVERSILNPFHFVDLYKYVANVQSEDIVAELVPRTEDTEIIDSLLGDTKGLKIGVELKSYWPAQNFIELIIALLTKYERSRIYLIGTLSERTIARTLHQSIPAELRRRCIDLSGQASINELLALVDRMHLFVGSGGISSHFAASVGTMTLTIDYLNQHLFQSCPYGHGHVIIADDNQDSDQINASPSSVFDIIRFIIETNDSKTPTIEQWQAAFRNKDLTINPRFKVFVTQRQVFHQLNGVERVDFVLEPVSTKNANLQECLIAIYRLIWQFDLNHSEDTMTEVIVSKLESINALPKLVTSLEKLHKLAKFGSHYAGFVLDDLNKNDIKQAKMDSDRLQEIDNLIYTLAREIEALAPISNFYDISQSQIRNTDPIAVAEKAKLSYERIQVHVNLVLDLIQEIVNRSKAYRDEPAISVETEIQR